MTVTKKERRDLSQAFERVDSDSNGKIDFVEFVTLLETLGADVDAAQAQFGFERVDTDDDGMIEFDEFVEWWRAT